MGWLVWIIGVFVVAVAVAVLVGARLRRLSGSEPDLSGHATRVPETEAARPWGADDAGRSHTKRAVADRRP